ncbi:hypothetical protein SSX86_024856 [Deinandra increscens subsp. villosa]|uniref:Histone chaperone domain-containing protein n=1 Tax=Deinandra increscens subsp. villosa TaxID=3103831 RepID=A0AAP0CHF9_9ASTR
MTRAQLLIIILKGVAKPLLLLGQGRGVEYLIHFINRIADSSLQIKPGIGGAMKEEESMEFRIKQAMRPRIQHFRDQADSLTFEGVRRLLEKDMVLDKYALDSHKKFVKQLLEKYLSGAEGDDESKGEDDKSKDSGQVKLEEETVKEAKVEDSPVMGLLSDKSESQGNATEKIPTEDMIKEAIWNKATYFRSKSEELTLVGVRRLLEEDLELQKFSLDSFKKLISKQLDEVLNSQSNKDADSSPSHGESEDIQDEVKPKKKLAMKEKVQKSEATKKRKKPAQETEKPRKKKIKHPEELSVEKNNVQNQSSDESSGGNSVKKEVVAPVYGKKVERLKSIIKACGMTVAPTVYKKAKQAPEDKREAVLLKELQEILSKEGLSTNPSEKEIKDVKRRKEKAKELEGIDTSNIVLGSRRRSTTFPPPRPKEPVESDGDESEDGDGSEDEDGSDGSDDPDDKAENVDASQSGEEVHAETFDSD